MGLCEGFRLLAFVVASTFGERGAASRLTSAQKHVGQTDLPSPDGDLSRLILSQLSLLLPSYSVPDTLVLVPALCQTPHGERQTHRPHRRRDALIDCFRYPYVCFIAGKVDMAALMKIYQRRRQCLKSDVSQGNITTLRQTLQSLWQVSHYFSQHKPTIFLL